MNWYLAAPFIKNPADRWLMPYIPDFTGESFSIPADYDHDRSRKKTGRSEWLDYWTHGNKAWNSAAKDKNPSGILTCFPQLPAIIGLRKRLSGKDIPIVAWTFNIGSLPHGMKRAIAQAGLSRVDRFIVHSTAEVESCSEWLQLPRDRFEFVPLQRAVLDATVDEDTEQPFVLAMGSAHRDYRLLFEVVRELAYPTVVVAGAHAVEGLSVPPNVELRRGLALAECHRLIQRARVNVIPVSNQLTASGQVTLLDAMMYGRAAIITSSPASADYVKTGVDGLLVKAADHSDLKQAIQSLWEDDALRRDMGEAARKTVMNNFSDEAIGVRLGRVLAEVGSSRPLKYQSTPRPT